MDAFVTLNNPSIDNELSSESTRKILNKRISLDWFYIEKTFLHGYTNACFGACRLPGNHKQPDKPAIGSSSVHFIHHGACGRYKTRRNNGCAPIGDFLPHDYSHSHIHRHANAGHPDRSQALRFRCMATN
jgi:hypothetical protein